MARARALVAETKNAVIAAIGRDPKDGRRKSDTLGLEEVLEALPLRPAVGLVITAMMDVAAASPRPASSSFSHIVLTNSIFGIQDMNLVPFRAAIRLEAQPVFPAEPPGRDSAIGVRLGVRFGLHACPVPRLYSQDRRALYGYGGRESLSL